MKDKKPKEKERKFSLSGFKSMLRNSLRLLGMLWQDKKPLVLGVFFVALITTAEPFLASWINGLVINKLVVAAGQGFFDVGLIWLVVFSVFIQLVLPVFSMSEDYLLNLVWFHLEEKFFVLNVKKRGEIDIAVHEDPKQNDLFNRVSEQGVHRIQRFVDNDFYMIDRLVSLVIASFIIVSSAWWLLPIIIIGILPRFLMEKTYAQENWRIWEGKAEDRRKRWEIGSYFERVSSLIELKVFQNAGHFLSIVKKLFREFQELLRQNEKRKIYGRIFAFVLSQATIVLAGIWFIYQVVEGNLMLGTFTFLSASVARLRQSMQTFFVELSHQYQDNLFINDVFKFLDIKPVIKKPVRAVSLNPRETPAIVFDNVTFAYPGTKKAVLKNFSLTISPGEKVALVGVNGAGKTTLVKLLCRFYDPTKGRILIGGHDLKTVNLETWYSQLGAIFQEYAEYHFLVKEVIAAGRTGDKPALQKVKDAAKASEADIFIEEWEKKYNQMLGKTFKGGIEPSVGQWQKLALARVFYRDPRVLILDEPTSSIDAEAEEKIFRKIESLPQDRTVIFISHRFSTVREANKIAVVQKGRISEEGTHEELMRLNQTYARLFELQAKKYQ